MSRIDKLSIQGIRSFAPNSRETIQFNTPLTLIVGYNGSGKTTIIECLKYATTGDQPPNSKGGAFIHDPKLCGEKEVLAQVKLSFRSAVASKYVVTRNLQLTVKKTTRSMKTLEGSLNIMNNGEKSVISTRVAALDEDVPKYLGVSRAILDAVIFCHQDESLWPMSEPAALKKRFDEIFEALKYTKAIDNLKLLRKRQGEDLTKLKIFEEQDRINKEKGDRAERRSRDLQAEIEAAREQCGAISDEMDEIQGMVREKHEQANSFLSIVQDLKNKRDQLEYRQDAVAELRMTLEELSEDDEWLEKTLSQYEERMARYKAAAEENRSQYAALQDDLTKARKDHSSQLAEQGRLQSDKEKYERQLVTRMEMVHAAAELHDFRGFDGELTNAQVKSFHDKVQKLLADKKRELDRIQKQNSKEVDKVNAAISELEGKKSARTQDRVFAKQRIGAIETRTEALQNDVKLIDIDEGAKALLDGQIKDVEGRLQQVQSDFEKSGYDANIQQENEVLWSLEAENERLGRELVECTRLASERAQLDLRKGELADRRRKLDIRIGAAKEKLDSAVGSDWTAATLEDKFQSSMRRQNQAVSQVRQKRDQMRDKLQTLSYRVKTAKDTEKSKSDEAARCEKAVYDYILTVNEEAASADDYPGEVSHYEEKVEESRTEISLWDALAQYYGQCQSTLTKKGTCRLCERPFEASQAAFRSRMEKKIKEKLNPKEKLESEKELDESSAILDALRNLRPQYDTYKRVNEELPGLKQNTKDIVAEYEALERQFEDAQAAVASEEEKLRDMESINETVLTITQLMRDIKDSEAQIERIQSQQSSGITTRSVDEIHDLQASCSEKMRVVKNKITKITADKQRSRDQLNSLELEKSELRNKSSHAAAQLQRKIDFQNQIQTLKEEHSHQREQIQRANEDLEALEPEIVEARSLRDDTLQRGRAKEQAVAEERDVVASTVSELKLVESDIQDYVARGGDSNLATNQRAIAGLEKNIADVEKEISDLTVRTNKLKQDINNGDRKKKNISDNLNYRKNLRMLDVLRRDIADLESRNADEDYERLVGEARSYESHYNKLLAERGSIMGSMKTKDEELERLLREWEMDYKDAARKYRESHIKVETTKAAIEDLGRYGAALDKAIMQYHSLKMEEINRIAGELWQSTYQGTDIDTILIRSDAETSTGKRNYNYRLCMVKQDAEMDMRGRCSAGQKVLASIIIRLALAESFGVNCGLIALDEPTTNLDRDNIKSLAESLHAIIKARQAQSNFQLIVITHDEDFLRHMRCSDFCDTFFRVRRDDRQNSVITRESITKVL
ncbi:probable RAD50 homolog uvs-6 [Cephalotrichum gorgonifer]|uniref:DNA repair protein RAD50 n=1 Tax=Cephalotrichum gorgonifer TaxID=2041049 RepID=A0AAE8MZ11_9PEZI|nr:probable RAD50 homolog uvs-6 [Cephalotrichum gorgonifer]